MERADKQVQTHGRDNFQDGFSKRVEEGGMAEGQVCRPCVAACGGECLAMPSNA